MASTFNKVIKQIGLMVLGGTLTIGGAGGGIFLNKLSTTGTVQQRDYFTPSMRAVFDVTATGSTTAKSGQAYDALCMSSPLQDGNLAAGTGYLVRLTVHNITNPAAANWYMGFVKSCSDNTASGSQVLTSINTGSGKSTLNNSGTIVWNGADKLKLVLLKDPTSSFDAKVTVEVEDILGQ